MGADGRRGEERGRGRKREEGRESKKEKTYKLEMKGKKLLICRWLNYLCEKSLGTSLAVQRLRLCTPNAGSTGSIPGQGTKIPHAAWRSQNKKKTATFPNWSTVSLSINMPASIFEENDKPILKFTWKCKVPRIAQWPCLKKKVGRHRLPDFKTAILVKGQIHRPMEKKRESMNDPHK